MHSNNDALNMSSNITSHVPAILGLSLAVSKESDADKDEATCTET